MKRYLRLVAIAFVIQSLAFVCNATASSRTNNTLDFIQVADWVSSI